MVYFTGRPYLPFQVMKNIGSGGKKIHASGNGFHM